MRDDKQISRTQVQAAQVSTPVTSGDLSVEVLEDRIAPSTLKPKGTV